MVENNDFYINEFIRCLFRCDISNRSILSSSPSQYIRRNEEMTSMLFVNIESIWNCTFYSFENDDEKENIVQYQFSFEYITNGVQFYDEKNEKMSIRKKWKITVLFVDFENESKNKVPKNKKSMKWIVASDNRKIISLKEIFKTKL
jgi:hypothetical protein